MGLLHRVFGQRHRAAAREQDPKATIVSAGVSVECPQGETRACIKSQSTRGLPNRFQFPNHAQFGVAGDEWDVMALIKPPRTQLAPALPIAPMWTPDILLLQSSGYHREKTT